MNKQQTAAAMSAKQRTEDREAEKQERASLLATAKDEGVGLVHIFDRNFPYGGLSVAFSKVSPYKSGKMVKVAVATCSNEDAFSKKLGTTLALNSFFNGETIRLPLLNSFHERDLNYAVKCAFTALYEHGGM